MPNLNQRPLVLATHLVPSLPIGLFEVLAEIFEVITKKPVVLLHETRVSRPVARDIVDIGTIIEAKDRSNGIPNNVRLLAKLFREKSCFAFSLEISLFFFLFKSLLQRLKR